MAKLTRTCSQYKGGAGELQCYVLVWVDLSCHLSLVKIASISHTVLMEILYYFMQVFRSKVFWEETWRINVPQMKML